MLVAAISALAAFGGGVEEGTHLVVLASLLKPGLTDGLERVEGADSINLEKEWGGHVLAGVSLASAVTWCEDCNVGAKLRSR